MTTWAQQASESPGDDTTPEKAGRVKPPVEYVTRQSLQVLFDKDWLMDEDDVDRYLEVLRQMLLKMISEGKRIQIQ